MADSSMTGAGSPRTPEFITMPRPTFDLQLEHEPEEMEEEELEQFEAEYQKEVKKYFKKPATDFPGYKWVISKKASGMIEKYDMECQKRDQDKFGMHIYNDFNGYGAQEVIENILQEFTIEYQKGPDASPYDLWAYIETLIWLFCDDSIDMGAWYGQDDGERFSETLRLIGCAILSILNVLEGAELLKPNSAVPNIALILSMVFQNFSYFGEAVADEPAQTWPNQIVAYAQKHGIKLDCVYDIEDTVSEWPAEELKAAIRNKINSSYVADKFSYSRIFNTFAKTHGRKVGGKACIGGTHYDITKMSKKERIKASLDGSDPLDTMGPPPTFE